jgi:hypothetical protein
MRCSKVSYPSLKSATRAAIAQRVKKGVLMPYRCFHCFKWHLTSQNPGDYLKRNKHITR